MQKEHAARCKNCCWRISTKRGPRPTVGFLMGTQVEGLPDRAGYYLGYLFAKSEGDGVPLPKLARMPLEEVHQRERAFLTRLGQP